MAIDNSQRFHSMVENIEELKTIFCTENVMDNKENKKSQVMIRAYLFMVHAEFESFIEDILAEKVKEDMTEYKSNNTISRSLSAIAAFFHSDNPSASFQNAGTTIETIVNKSTVEYKSSLLRNNGIKEENLVPLLRKIGINTDSINETNFLEVNEFGKTRGSIAHNSSVSMISNLINIDDEEKRIKNIIASFKEIDLLVLKN